jgi:hypothetical protein
MSIPSFQHKNVGSKLAHCDSPSINAPINGRKHTMGESHPTGKPLSMPKVFYGSPWVREAYRTLRNLFASLEKKKDS